ncbi:MAG: hypothetical protein OHK93_002045 [Ramalina farinacea]|uniref:Uncharacterized protein n=1 Tax=Ramalina farinacea TaxID=258253 RepID=A0AA43QQP4_9LECA|nr:hypothetical protein [Ramalina farinacea]
MQRWFGLLLSILLLFQSVTTATAHGSESVSLAPDTASRPEKMQDNIARLSVRTPGGRRFEIAFRYRLSAVVTTDTYEGVVNQMNHDAFDNANNVVDGPHTDGTHVGRIEPEGNLPWAVISAIWETLEDIHLEYTLIPFGYEAQWEAWVWEGINRVGIVGVGEGPLPTLNDLGLQLIENPPYVGGFCIAQISSENMR